MSDDFFDQFGDVIERFKRSRSLKRKKPAYIDKDIGCINENSLDLNNCIYAIIQKQGYINDSSGFLNKKWIEPKKRML